MPTSISVGPPNVSGTGFFCCWVWLHCPITSKQAQWSIIIVPDIFLKTITVKTIKNQTPFHFWEAPNHQVQIHQKPVWLLSGPSIIKYIYLFRCPRKTLVASKVLGGLFLPWWVRRKVSWGGFVFTLKCENATSKNRTYMYVNRKIYFFYLGFGSVDWRSSQTLHDILWKGRCRHHQVFL